MILNGFLKKIIFQNTLIARVTPPPPLHGKWDFKFPFFGTRPQASGNCVNMKNVLKKVVLVDRHFVLSKMFSSVNSGLWSWNMILRCLKPDFQVQRKIPRVIAKSFVLAVENWGSIKRFKFQLIEAGAEWGFPNLQYHIIKVSCQRTFNRF